MLLLASALASDPSGPPELPPVSVAAIAPARMRSMAMPTDPARTLAWIGAVRVAVAGGACDTGAVTWSADIAPLLGGVMIVAQSPAAADLHAHAAEIAWACGHRADARVHAGASLALHPLGAAPVACPAPTAIEVPAPCRLTGFLLPD